MQIFTRIRTVIKGKRYSLYFVQTGTTQKMKIIQN